MNSRTFAPGRFGAGEPRTCALRRLLKTVKGVFKPLLAAVRGWGKPPMPIWGMDLPGRWA